MNFDEAISDIINKDGELGAINYLVDSLVEKKLRQDSLNKRNTNTLYEGYLKIKDTMDAIKMVLHEKFHYSDKLIDTIIRESKIERKFIENLEECMKRTVSYWSIWLYDYYQEFADKIDEKVEPK